MTLMRRTMGGCLGLAARVRPAAAALSLSVLFVLGACATASRPDGGNNFMWPIDGPEVSGFGPKPGNRFNDGINIGAPAGTPVRAAADGTVIYVGNELRGFGNLILIRHAAGWTSAYAHTEQIRVKRNQRVDRGAIIAAVGQSGSVACPQLHFELRREAKAVDPAGVMPRRPRTYTASTGASSPGSGCTPGEPALPGS